MFVFQLVLCVAVAVASLGLGTVVQSAPVTQECQNCIITTALTSGREDWLRSSLKHIDDELTRRSDYQELQLESGEEQDLFSRWLFKHQGDSRLRNPSNPSSSRIKRAPMKKKNSKEHRHGPGKHNHDHQNHSHEHHRHSHEHKHKHSHEHRPRPKPGKHSKERTTTMMPETTSIASTTPLSTSSSTTQSTTSSTTTSTTPASTKPSTTTPSTTTPSTTTLMTTSSTTPSTSNLSTTTESTTTTTTSTTTPEPTTPESENANAQPAVRKRRSAAVLSLSSNEDNKQKSKDYKTGKQSPGKQNKESSNIKQDGYKTKSTIEENLEVLTKLNNSHLHTDNITLIQNDTALPNELQTNAKNLTLVGRSSEEVDDSIEDTAASVNDLVTQMTESDEVNSVESTEDYGGIFTTEPPSIEKDSQSVEDMGISKEEPDDISSNETYDYYSDEDNSTEETPKSPDSNESSSLEDIYQTTPYPDSNSMESVEDTLDSKESNETTSSPEDYNSMESVEDILDSKESNETTSSPEDNNSMESIEADDILEDSTETPDSKESVIDSIETGLTEYEPVKINSKESNEKPKKSSANINSKESKEDDEEED